MPLSDYFIDAGDLPPGAAGYVQLLFLAAVYGFILFKASKLISAGSELLQLVLPPGLVGSIVLPVLGALPDGALVLFAGLGDNAQEQLNVGMGTLAGSTVMVLSLPWAAALIVGRVDLSADGRTAQYGKRAPRLTVPHSLTGAGIATSGSVLRTACIMLASSAVYVMVQVVAWSGASSSAGTEIALAGMVLSGAAFFAYLAYQLCSSSAQEAAAARRTALLKEAYKSSIVDFGTLFEIEHAAHTAGGGGGDGSSGLSATAARAPFDPNAPPAGEGEDGSVSLHMLRHLFDAYDANGDGNIDAGELRVLLRDAGVKLTKAQLRDVMADVGGGDMLLQFSELQEVGVRRRSRGG